MFFVVSVSYVPQLCIHMLLVAGGSVAPAALLACLGPPLLPVLSAHLHRWPACRWLVRDGPSLGPAAQSGWWQLHMCVAFCWLAVLYTAPVECMLSAVGTAAKASCMMLMCSVIDAFCTAVTAQWDLTPFAKAWVVPHWQCITAQH
jgi:hypothetical protein